MEIKQKNFGIKNRNISINIDKLTVDLDNGYEIKVSDFFEAYAVALEEYNEKIKEKVGSEVLVNKTNSLKNFDIAKIITSLLSIGIPLDATFDIAKNAAE